MLLSWWEKTFRYASKNSAVWLTEGSDVDTHVLAAEETPVLLLQV